MDYKKQHEQAKDRGEHRLQIRFSRGQWSKILHKAEQSGLKVTKWIKKKLGVL